MPLSAPDKSARVGVILPTRNRAGSLRAALDSVLDQTWRDLEVLVVDDASTDATAECLAGVTDPRVRVLRLDHPHGAGGARNAGLKAMDNDWIAFQDSDDRWLPEKLEKQLAAVEAAGNKAGFAYCRCRRSGAGVSYLFPPIHARTVAGELFEALLGGNLVSTQTALVRRACIDAHGRFDEALPPLEDWEFFLRLSRHVKAVFVDEVLVEAPFSPDSISKQDANFIASFQGILKQYAADYAERPRLHARHLGTIADRLCLSGHWEEGREQYSRAFCRYPWHLGHAAGIVLSAWPQAYKRFRRWRMPDLSDKH
jgi:glycosyltransferase involved in cell wall biosynthesis